MNQVRVAVVLLVVLGMAGVAHSQAVQPNFVVVMLDDQDAFSPYWEAMPHTASLLRDQGTTFTHAICPTPVCTPGRVAFLSGRLAHNTGVFQLVGPHDLVNFATQTNQTFAVELANLGYVNALLGKGLGTTGILPGFSDWCVLSGEHLYEGTRYVVNEHKPGLRASSYVSQKYSTDFLADRPIKFLRTTAPGNAPFFVWITPTAPHLPLPPAARHQAVARATWTNQLNKGPNFNEQDISDKSSWLRKTGAVRSGAVPYAVGEYHKRMGSLMAVDEMISKIQNELIAEGKWNNTILILTSDNGYNLGSHRLIHKMAPYEESIRVPLIIAGPGVANASFDKLVGLHDIGPTLIDLAGGTPPAAMDGKSFGRMLRDGAKADVSTWRTSILTEFDPSVGGNPGYNPGGIIGRAWNLDIPTYRSVRTEQFKYILWTDTNEEELYDLNADPFELANVLHGPGSPGYANVRANLAGQLQYLRSAGGLNSP